MTDSTKAFLRQALMCDRAVQGSILGRAALYGFAFLVYVGVILLFTQRMSNLEMSWGEHFTLFFIDAAYWVPGILLAAPLIAYDLLRLTNRFAGPIYRLRVQMDELAAGKRGEELRFRDGDYWGEVAESFNRLRKEILDLRSAQLRRRSGTAKAEEKSTAETE